MSVYVYALQSMVDGRIYVGQTADLQNRIKQHNAGCTKTTWFYKPWKLIFKVECFDRIQAREKEKYLKSGCSKEFLRNKCACSSNG